MIVRFKQINMLIIIKAITDKNVIALLYKDIMGNPLACKTDVKITANEVTRMEVMPKITNHTHHQLSERKNHCQHQLMQSKIGDTAVSSQYGHSTVEVQQHYHSSLMTVRQELRDSTATVVMW